MFAYKKTGNRLLENMLTNFILFSSTLSLSFQGLYIIKTHKICLFTNNKVRENFTIGTERLLVTKTIRLI